MFMKSSDHKLGKSHAGTQTTRHCVVGHCSNRGMSRVDTLLFLESHPESQPLTRAMHLLSSSIPTGTGR